MAMSSWGGLDLRAVAPWGADVGIFAGRVSFREGHSVLVAARDPMSLRPSIVAMRALGLRISLILRPQEVVARALAVQPSAVVVSAEHDLNEAAVVCARLGLEERLSRVPLVVVLSGAQRALKSRFYDLGVTGSVVLDGEAEELSLKVGALIRHLALPTTGGHAIEGAAGGNGSVVRQLCQYLLGKLGQMVSIEDVERRFGMERRSLNRMFVQETGLTIFAWYHEQRMALAQRLLREGGFPIQQIAADLGYSSVCNFSTAFRMKFGLSPRQFRAQGAPCGEPRSRLAAQGSAVALL